MPHSLALCPFTYAHLYICLMSYYVMGKSDGSNLPQLHIIKTPGTLDNESLYFAFSEYFDKMWEDSDPWDFKEFL
jgi:hypothetical protein